ncbi:MAG: hypothetical protein AAF566_11520 [Pseudomonadota bacterium]
MWLAATVLAVSLAPAFAGETASSAFDVCHAPAGTRDEVIERATGAGWREIVLDPQDPYRFPETSLSPAEMASIQVILLELGRFGRLVAYELDKWDEPRCMANLITKLFQGGGTAAFAKEGALLGISSLHDDERGAFFLFCRFIGPGRIEDIPEHARAVAQPSASAIPVQMFERRASGTSGVWFHGNFAEVASADASELFRPGVPDLVLFNFLFFNRLREAE